MFVELLITVKDVKTVKAVNGVNVIERLSDRLLVYLETAIGREVNLKDIRAFLKIESGSKDDQNLRTQMATTMVLKKKVKPSGRNDGVYKVLTPVKPVEWSLDGEDKEGILDVRFPRSYIDDTTFGIGDLVEISEGDLILITGETNYGKTAIALSMLGENLDLMPSDLMGSEYTSSNEQISPKLKRRLRRMNWVQWMDGEGKPKFKLWPVGADYEEYVLPDHLSVIDWISLPGEYYLIDRVMKTIKDGVGLHGLAIPVIQKNKSAEFGEGGQRSERYADLVLKVDRFGEHESILTIGKVKAAKGKSPTGRTWAFGITDYGANLIDIREVVKCPKCWGKGYIRDGQNNKRCPSCEGKKYINKV